MTTRKRRMTKDGVTVLGRVCEKMSERVHEGDADEREMSGHRRDI